jgi:hypothetical protein
MSLLDKMNLIIDHEISVYDVLQAKAAKCSNDEDIEGSLKWAASDLSRAIYDLIDEDPIRVLGVVSCNLFAPISLRLLKDDLESEESEEELYIEDDDA